MNQPGARDLIANRWQGFQHVIAFVGFDFTGAIFALQVRATRDRLDSPLISLENGSPGSEGISGSVAVNGGVPTYTMTIQIAEATIEAIALSNPAGGDLILAYDLVITGGGLPKTRWLEGAFTIHAGVTHG